MIKSLIDWLSNKKSLFIFGAFVFLLTIILKPYFDSTITLGKFDGDIQNKLVWSVKGECFFVKPVNGGNMVLVRVSDCDKVGK